MKIFRLENVSTNLITNVEWRKYFQCDDSLCEIFVYVCVFVSVRVCVCMLAYVVYVWVYSSVHTQVEGNG